MQRHSGAIPHGAAHMRHPTRVATWIATLCCLAATAQAADVHLLTAARIHTSHPEQPHVEAMAWNETGRLLAVGAATTLQAPYPAAISKASGRDRVLQYVVIRWATVTLKQKKN